MDNPFQRDVPCKSYLHTRKRITILYDVRLEKTKCKGPGAGRSRKAGKRERQFLETGRVSCELTLLALGIIRPAKEIGIARNSWEGVEFHMKYT